MNCSNCRREIAEASNFCYFCGSRQPVAPTGTPVAHKRLMRSVVDCKIAGVCGGIAEYLEVDSTIVRLVWVLLIFLPVPIFPAFIGYFVAWLIVPQAPVPYAPAPQTQPANAPNSTQTA